MKHSQKKHVKKYKPVTLDPFESAAIQIMSGNLTLKSSKDGGFALYNRENVPMVYQVKDGQLQLIQNKAVPAETVLITIPEKESLHSLKVQIQSGDLTCKGIKAQNADLLLGSGDLTLNKVNFSGGSCQMSKGKVYAKGDILSDFTFRRTVTSSEPEEPEEAPQPETSTEEE